MQSLCLLIASLMLSACNHLRMPSEPQTTPPLDQYLKSDCDTLTEPETLDFDDWMAWVKTKLLPSYGDCAIRHRKTVDAWPK